MAIVQLLRLAAARIVGQRLGNSHMFSQYFAIKKAPFHEFLIPRSCHPQDFCQVLDSHRGVNCVKRAVFDTGSDVSW